VCKVCQILRDPMDNLWLYSDGKHWYFLVTGGSLCGKSQR